MRIRWLSAAALGVAATLAYAPASAAIVPAAHVPAAHVPAAQEPATEAERAAAIVTPAMVEVQTTWRGYVRSRITGEVIDPQNITVTLRCAGFGVSSDGHLVTAGQCVDHATVAMEFYRQVAAHRVERGEMPADQTQALLDDLFLNGVVGGSAVDITPQRTVTVRREVADGDPLPATVISVAPPAAGDIALLKIEKTNQPLVRLASPADITTGREIVTVEYQAGSTDQPPTSRAGSIASTTPALLAHAGPSDPLAGAPVLTLDGDIAGVLSRHQPAAATDVLASVAAILPELEKHDVTNELTQMDNDYRAGLDAFYDGRYTDSIEKFDAVLAVIPSHQQAHDFRQQAQALRGAQAGTGQPEQSTFDTIRDWLFGGVVGPLMAAAVVLALALVLVRRRAHHVREPAAPVRKAAPSTPAAAVAPSAGRTRLATPTYCTNCSNALPPAATTCALCGHPTP